MSHDLRTIEVNRPSTKQLLNNFLGKFLEKFKQFRGKGQKWIAYKKSVHSNKNKSLDFGEKFKNKLRTKSGLLSRRT